MEIEWDLIITSTRDHADWSSNVVHDHGSSWGLQPKSLNCEVQWCSLNITPPPKTWFVSARTWKSVYLMRSYTKFKHGKICTLLHEIYIYLQYNNKKAFKCNKDLVKNYLPQTNWSRSWGELFCIWSKCNRSSTWHTEEASCPT
jgi:hypothetical protein